MAQIFQSSCSQHDGKQSQLVWGGDVGAWMNLKQYIVTQCIVLCYSDEFSLSPPKPTNDAFSRNLQSLQFIFACRPIEFLCSHSPSSSREPIHKDSKRCFFSCFFLVGGSQHILPPAKDNALCLASRFEPHVLRQYVLTRKNVLSNEEHTQQPNMPQVYQSH